MKFRLSTIATALAVAVGFAAAPAAHAAIVNDPVPDNAVIEFAGLKWAWASPVAADGSFGPGSALDLSAQAAAGWRLPTAAELLNAPTALQFLFAGANVPAGAFDSASGDPNSGAFFDKILASDGACAAAYFSNFSQCDWNNGPGSGGSNPLPWWGQLGSTAFSETLVVNNAPIPATWPLMITGLAGLGFGAFRKKKGAAVSAAA